MNVSASDTRRLWRRLSLHWRGPVTPAQRHGVEPRPQRSGPSPKAGRRCSPLCSLYTGRFKVGGQAPALGPKAACGRGLWGPSCIRETETVCLRGQKLNRTAARGRGEPGRARAPARASIPAGAEQGRLPRGLLTDLQLVTRTDSCLLWTRRARWAESQVLQAKGPVASPLGPTINLNELRP